MLERASADPSDSVRAFRLALYGRNADVKGVDISVVGVTDGNFVGDQWNGIGIIKGNAYGLIGAFYSGLAYVGGDVNGLSAALVNFNFQPYNARLRTLEPGRRKPPAPGFRFFRPAAYTGKTQ